MKSIPQMAEELNISSGTIREYLSRFDEFFPDPVEHEGVKEYPPETAELIQRINGYYQNSGMTKEEIRVKLGGVMEEEARSGPAQAAAAPAMDMEQFGMLTEKLDRLIEVIETLTSRLEGIPAGGGAAVASPPAGKEKIQAVNAQITDILGMNQADDPEEIAKKVKDSDGTVIFSYGRMAQPAIEAMKNCKEFRKPWIHIDLETEVRPAFAIRTWLQENKVKTVNVAGRSASKIPGLKKTINEMIASIMNM